MAKKSSNPVDAFRKQQRARELKKNREGRKQVRETQTVKKDTRELESEIRELKGQGKLDAAAKTRLSELKSELSYIAKVKEKFVSEHPEARDKVFRQHREGGPRRDADGDEDVSHLYNKEGKLRDPTRSVYYDPVYNPFGVPPPGMPYRETTPDEEDEESDESEEESDDEIIMPVGPPPEPNEDEDSDESDDIPLPGGPPPPKAIPLPTAGASTFSAPPMRLPVRPPFAQLYMPQMGMPPFPPGPSSFHPAPTRPPHRAAVPHNRPPTFQDPLSDAPTQTYQGYRMSKHELPPRPTSSSAGITDAVPKPASSAPPTGNGTISAEPQLRDFRKEATAFVPRGVKRKKAPTGGVEINAAPGAGEIDADGDEVRTKRSDGGGLMGKLSGVLGEMKRDEKKGGGDDDYQKFLEGLGDLA